MAEGDDKLLGMFPCESPGCGSSDACAHYEDGHKHCFSCGAHTSASGESKDSPEPERAKGLIRGEYVPLTARMIDAATCQKFGYECGTFGGKDCQIAPYFDKHGAMIGQKLRFKDKTFMGLGNMKKALLFGQQLWRDGGKMLVITEGEIDAMTVSMLQGNRWPVVSIPSGAEGAAEAIARNLDWVSKFESVVLMFDNDEPGINAAKETALLLPPGRCKIASLPLKDPNEMLLKGKGREVIDAIWGAKVFRPDGILDSDEVLHLVETAPARTPIAVYPYPVIQSKTRGIFPGSVNVITGGSGTGKTEFTRSIILHNLKTNPEFRAGIISLEEDVPRAAIGFVGMDMGIRLDWVEAPTKVEGFYESWNRIIKDRVFFYDHRGAMDLDNIEARIRYLRVANRCDVVVLDNLTIMATQMEGDNERILIDTIVARLAQIVQETGVAIILCCHLKRPSGTPHEEGGETSLGQLRGSGGIGNFVMVAMGLERNQQDPETPNLLTFRILKNRNTGKTGVAGQALYDEQRGTFEPVGEATAITVSPLPGGEEPGVKAGGF